MTATISMLKYLLLRRMDRTPEYSLSGPLDSVSLFSPYLQMTGAPVVSLPLARAAPIFTAHTHTPPHPAHPPHPTHTFPTPPAPASPPLPQGPTHTPDPHV